MSLVLSVAGAVAAHHAEVTAEMDCDGLVTYTVTAWNGDTEASRTNTDIGVWVKVDDGSFDEQASGEFNAGNDFSFDDTYSAPGAASVTVKVQAQANWANGTGPGDSRQVTVHPPEGCPPPPVDCEANPQAEGCEPPPVDCEANPQAEGCEQPVDCETNPQGEGCEPPPVDCEANPQAEGCQSGVELPATGTPAATLPSTSTEDGTDPPTGGSSPLLFILLAAGATGIVVLSPMPARRRRQR